MENVDLLEDFRAFLETDPNALQATLWVASATGAPATVVLVLVPILVFLALIVWLARTSLATGMQTYTKKSVEDALKEKGWQTHLVQTLEASGAEKRGEIEELNRNWSNRLAQVLEQTRGVERQKMRAASYGQLWKKTRPLAVYADRPFTRSEAAAMSETLTEWYFSETGGLMMTPHVRDLYFGLQDLLRGVAHTARGDWTTRRCHGSEDKALAALLQSDRLREVLPEDSLASILGKGPPSGGTAPPGAPVDLGTAIPDMISTIRPDPGHGDAIETWPPESLDAFKRWRRLLTALAHADVWLALSEEDRFVVLQQTTSILRTAMAKDMDARDL